MFARLGMFLRWLGCFNHDPDMFIRSQGRLAVTCIECGWESRGIAVGVSASHVDRVPTPPTSQAEVHIKKKRFQAFCRAQVKKGLINHADGTWKPASDHQMDRMMVAGYKLG